MKKSNNLVSIILPFFNSEKWIKASIESLLNQTYKNTEILVYNDGSTDTSLDICNQLAKKNSNIRIISSTTNNGIVHALNTLREHAQGDYIARMDADDICRPQRIENQLNWMAENDIDICGTWFTEFGQGIPRVARWPVTHKKLNTALLFQNSICHPTILGKRKVFSEFEYREEFNLAEDYDFFIRVIKSFKFGNVPESLLRYRRHPNQATQYKKATMESVTKTIRTNALKNIGICPTQEQIDTHHMIRAPQSITSTNDLIKIEEWLKFLLRNTDSNVCESTIASQWIRACIRAAPLGKDMRNLFFSSPLFELCGANTLTKVDMWALSLIKIDYNSKFFNYLRRLGLSA